MIADSDRSGYFGASDVRYIVGNRKTKSFEKWWQIKLGIARSDYQNEAMAAGTNFEHPILEFLGCSETDKQIIIPEILLRVNCDGNSRDKIFEIKTYSLEKGFKVPKHYRDQVNVQMYAWLKSYGVLPKASIYAYGLERADYGNFFRPIDGRRLSEYPIEYDEEWINKVFLPNIFELSAILREGRFP